MTDYSIVPVPKPKKFIWQCDVCGKIRKFCIEKTLVKENNKP